MRDLRGRLLTARVPAEEWCERFACGVARPPAAAEASVPAQPLLAAAAAAEAAASG